MKTHMKKISGVIGLLGLLVSSTAVATAPSLSNPATIKSIEVGTISGICDGSTGCTGNGTATFLQFNGNTTPGGAFPAKPTCSTSADTVVLFSPQGQADAIKSMSSIATAAFLSGKSVKIFYDVSCTSGFARVIGLSIV